jgi:hypothetical protein
MRRTSGNHLSDAPDFRQKPAKTAARKMLRTKVQAPMGALLRKLLIPKGV